MPGQSAGERPIRLGYVGCGFMGQKMHLPNFAGLPGCERVALAEVRPRLRERVAERYRIPRRYEGHEQLAADPEVEAVGVSGGFVAQGEIAAARRFCYERPVPQPCWSWSYRREAEHVIACLQSGAPFRSSGEDTLAAVRLFEEIYRAYLQQRGAV